MLETFEIIKLYQSVNCAPSPLDLLLVGQYYTELHRPYLFAYGMAAIILIPALLMDADFRRLKKETLLNVLFFTVMLSISVYIMIAALYWLPIMQQYC